MDKDGKTGGRFPTPDDPRTERKIIDHGAERIRQREEENANPLAPPVNTGAGS